MGRVGRSVSSSRQRHRSRRCALRRHQLITISTVRRHHTRTKRHRSSFSSSDTSRRVTSFRTRHYSQHSRHITRSITHRSSTLQRTHTSHNTRMILIRLLSRQHTSSTYGLTNSQRAGHGNQRNRTFRVNAQVLQRQSRQAHTKRPKRLSLRRMSRRRTRPRQQHHSHSSQGSTSHLIRPHVAMRHNRRTRSSYSSSHGRRSSRHRLRYSQRHLSCALKGKILISTMRTRITVTRASRVKPRLQPPELIMTRLIPGHLRLHTNHILTRHNSYKVMLQRQRRRRRRGSSSRYRRQRNSRSTPRGSRRVARSVSGNREVKGGKVKGANPSASHKKGKGRVGKPILMSSHRKEILHRHSFT